jgi:hypothetical protein
VKALYFYLEAVIISVESIRIPNRTLDPLLTIFRIDNETSAVPQVNLIIGGITIAILPTTLFALPINILIISHVTNEALYT